MNDAALGHSVITIKSVLLEVGTPFETAPRNGASSG
jgi:hypothetical protein